MIPKSFSDVASKVIHGQCYELTELITAAPACTTVEFLSWLLCNTPALSSSWVLLKSHRDISELGESDWRSVVEKMKAFDGEDYGKYALASFFLVHTARDLKFLSLIGINLDEIIADQDAVSYWKDIKAAYWGPQRERLVGGDYKMLGLSEADLMRVQKLGLQL